ncbi:MAG: hypothetical protein ACRENU_08380 [Gemmatimonadaceae bacterium]
MKQPAGGLLGGGAKTIAAVASTGAALVSIVTFLNAWGLFGTPAARESVANMGAKWIGIRPAADTARALYDTLHLAATITDKNGSVIEGVRPTWTTENPYVADVLQDGSVIAKGAGGTTIIALIGELSARARVVVHQNVHRVHIEGDTTVAMAEGDRRGLEVRAFDRRGYVLPARPVVWSSKDSNVAAVDSAGNVLAGDVGRAIVSASIDGVSAQALVNVAPAPAAIAALKGSGQRGLPGATLSERVIVRVVNRRGRPVEGTLVRFRPVDDGIVDPAAVTTDADGRARATWILGNRPGRQRILASVERVDSALTLEAEVDPPPSNTRLAAITDTLAGTVGKLADGEVGVRLTDSTGRAFADVPVAWTALDGGSVETLAERTDSLGELKVRWTLGPKARPQRLRARVAGGQGVTVTALAAAAAPKTLTLERARVTQQGDARNVAVVATVKDTFGNVVPRAAVSLVPRNGTVATAAVESDSTGAASVVWTLAANPRDQILIATLKGAPASDTLAVRAPAPVTAAKQAPITTKQAGRPRRPR